MSFPSQEDLNALSKGKDGLPDRDLLPRETVSNVILNCLADYTPKERKEIFYVSNLARIVLDYEDSKVELNEKHRKFLAEVLYSSVIQEDGKDERGRTRFRGLYASWVIAQCLDELGEKMTEDEK